MWGTICNKVLDLINRWMDRNKKIDIDPKIKKALQIREEVNDQTNRQLIKLQNRKMEDLQRELDNINGKLDAILHKKRSDPPT